MTTNKEKQIIAFLDEAFPDAKCSLIFTNAYQCLIAVMLSAQATDKSVNEVTPELFGKYGDFAALSKAEQEDVESIIKSVGLYHAKAKNAIALSKAICQRHGGEMPLDFESLTKLPGVGVKTANVVLCEIAARPAIAVDTHVSRVSKRLGYAKADEEPIKIEKKLEGKFPRENWIRLHHQLIHFGREICHAKKPECGRCGLCGYCSYFKKTSSTKGR